MRNEKRLFRSVKGFRAIGTGLGVISVGMMPLKVVAVAVGLGLAVGEGLGVTKESTRVGGMVGLVIAWLLPVQALRKSMNRAIHAKEGFPIKFLSASESAFFIAQKSAEYKLFRENIAYRQAKIGQNIAACQGVVDAFGFTM